MQIIGYELRLACLSVNEPNTQVSVDSVTNDDMEGFYHHLKEVLIQVDFLDESAPKLLMRRLKKIFNRIRLDRSELNILRGILSAVQRSTRR